MRTAFINSLIELAEDNPRIFLIVGDLGFSVVESFAEKFPDRFLNAGIAEQNMTGVAAGLASEGYHVFTYSIANFHTLRCIEQIRNDVAYHDLPVTTVAVGGGLVYGNLGYSHHAVQDYAVLRTIPNMMLVAPGDPVETRACLHWLVEHPCPSYMRLGRTGELIFNQSVPVVGPGELVVIKEPGSTGRLVLTTGATLVYGREFTEQPEFADWGLASVPIWGELCRTGLALKLSRYRQIIVIEDHLYAGGFGSFIGETLIMKSIRGVDMRCMALDPCVCRQVMKQESLNALGGISFERFRGLVSLFG